MKKHLLFLALTICSLTTFAQKDGEADFFKKDESTGDYYYEEVVQADGLKKEVMFERAKNWIIANFKTGDNNIKFDDKDFAIDNSAAVKIDQKSFFTSAIQEGAYNFKFHVWFKDDRYKIRVDNIMYYVLIKYGTDLTPNSFSYGDLKNNKMGKYLKEQASEKTNSVIAVFKNAVLTEQASPAKKDDW